MGLEIFAMTRRGGCKSNCGRPMEMELEIRAMARRDVPRVHELECICFRTPWSKLALFGELRNDVAHYRVAELDGQIIGYAGMWVLFEEAHLTNVAVAPEYRRKGYAMQLLLAMMECAKQNGATMMTLEVRESNLGAQNLYRQMDFVQNGLRPRYYSDTGEAALLLWNMDIQKTMERYGR